MQNGLPFLRDDLFSLLLKLIKFSLVGLSGMFIDFGVTYLLKEYLKLHKYLSNASGFITAVVSNYFFNRVWTFQSQDQRIFQEFLLFVLVSVIGLGINTFFLWVFHEKVKIRFYLAKFFAIVVTTLWNFAANYFITFT